MENREVQKEYLESIWEQISPDSTLFLDQNFQTIAPSLLKLLVFSLIYDDFFEIGNLIKDNSVYSIVSYDIYNTDKRLELVMNHHNKFELFLTVYDWDQEEHIYNYKLNEADIEVIPQGLQNLMLKVINSENPIMVKKEMLD